MRNSDWRDRFNSFMQGRYGEDALSRFLLALALIFLLLDFFIRTPVFGILAGLTLIWVYYRMLSRDYDRRAAENRKFLELKEKVTSFFRGIRNGSWASPSGSTGTDPAFRIYRCPKCGQKIRIPRGHGKVEITCPRCRTRFRKRT